MDETSPTGRSGRMPVLFVGHGSPMNAIEDNKWSRGFRALSRMLPRPRAILSISAHWFTRGSFLTGGLRPRTIHDFSGFPPALDQIRYPAPGEPDLAERVVRLLDPREASVRMDWGLDHGTWSVLLHVFPQADRPVVQLSVDSTLRPGDQIEIGRSLAPLRDEGVLIMGSGNITHNLRHAMISSARGDLSTPGWASRFDAAVAVALERHDPTTLARLIEEDEGRMAHPTLDHYLPLLYVAGAADADDAVGFPIQGFDLGSLSMRSVLFG